MPICIKCIHKDIDGPACSNSDLPITEFVYGVRACSILNPKGDCKGFKPQASIYESKEDENLAHGWGA